MTATAVLLDAIGSIFVKKLPACKRQPLLHLVFMNHDC